MTLADRMKRLQPPVARSKKPSPAAQAAPTPVPVARTPDEEKVLARLRVCGGKDSEAGLVTFTQLDPVAFKATVAGLGEVVRRTRERDGPFVATFWTLTENV